MKVAVTSTGPTLDDNVEARFGRCAYFLIIDTDTMQFEPIENPNVALGGGAGVQSAQLMSEKGVTTVLTGNCGPNAFNVFGQVGVQVIVGLSGPVRGAIEQFKTGSFSSASGPNVTSHFGMGGGRGMGRGGGTGRGMGRGIDRAGYPAGFPAAPAAKQEQESLKQQAEYLQQSLDDINKRIEELEKEKAD